MNRNELLLFVFSLLWFCSSSVAFAEAFNISTFFISSNAIDTKPHVLKDVLKTISLKENWNSKDIKVNKVRNLRIGSSQRYEFRIRMGKSDLLFRFSDELKNSWRKVKGKRKFGVNLVSEISSEAVLKKFELNGPFELRVDGDDELKLKLPVNITHSGLKRLIVSEGITVSIEGAREISLFHASDFGLRSHRHMGIVENRNQYGLFSQCIPLPPIHILGSPSLIAYRTHNPNAYIKTSFLSPDMIELLPEKCYSVPSYKKQGCPINALTPRLDLLEKIMRKIPGDRLLQNGISGFLKAKITASSLIHFKLEMERNIQVDDTLSGTLAEWRTKLKVERVQFEVVARVEGERLMPLVVKKVRPFIAADSTTWSNLMSNISFTKFPSRVVPPEALTLDVKW
ncbi:hypothetical protein AQUCO_01000313v1 [Aquilegia coerulea]|uniref:Signal peptidase I n=1 Tax=Aquilegia coerulea TaxID=218851 RepID=A0A2G5E9F5_AQUCA|nr:hypothetical protein AQUCO_01000313v1 [Aquilegia coerulea]